MLTIERIQNQSPTDANGDINASQTVEMIIFSLKYMMFHDFVLHQISACCYAFEVNQIEPTLFV